MSAPPFTTSASCRLAAPGYPASDASVSRRADWPEPEEVVDAVDVAISMRRRYLDARRELEALQAQFAQEVEQRVAQERERLMHDWRDIADSVDRLLESPQSAIREDLCGVSRRLRDVLEQQEASPQERCVTHLPGF